MARTAVQEPSLVFPRPKGEDEAGYWLSREWLATNGLGGYASRTLLGVATRRYHGLFVPNLPVHGRIMVVPRLDQEAEIEGRRFQLSGAEYADGRLISDCHRWLEEFRLEWQVPTWRFDLEDCRLEKRVVMPYGQHTVYVQYTVLAGKGVRLRLRPYVTCRMHDAHLSTAAARDFTLTVRRGRFEVPLPDCSATLKLCLRPPGGMFVAEDHVAHDVSYRVDRDRGSEHVEDLFSPGYFVTDLAEGRSVSFVASLESWDLLEFDGGTILAAERQRVEKVVSLSRAARGDECVAHLTLAADQFIVLPGSRLGEQVLARAAGDEARTIIAGYHWFTDWGRDTMISLEGLTLCTGRHEEAREILRTFSQYIKDGLLPNLFPEGSRQGLYHTADATLWFFHALDRYYTMTGDRDTLMALYPELKKIVAFHYKGTKFGIQMDDDGLLKAGVPGYQLTWMDAKVDDWVVTPRRGKPVEVQALWYNALRLMAVWSQELNERTAQWSEMAARAKESFNGRFWHDGGGYLYDVIDGEQGDDDSMRPNQIFSISLPHAVLDESRWKQVVNVVAERLVTPYGLRTLAPGHRDYKPMYFGDLRARDAAYHQGTVWAWLIGHYIDAWLKVYGDKAQARSLLGAFPRHVREAGVGTISEVFDADEPYEPRGCIAQAWSVAEVLRAHLNTRDG